MINTRGIILLDKPLGMFSRTAGGRVARMFGTKTFGHIGTLDEMASGVLPIAIGGATKMIPFIEDVRPNVKEYMFTVQFGTETDTLDTRGRITRRTDKIPSRNEIDAILPKLTGDVLQTPPIFSAVHVAGCRAYELARRADDARIEIAPRCVHLDTLEIIDGAGDTYTFRTRCSRGTYVRAIARDMAYMCDTVATVKMIRRTESLGFTLSDTVQLDFLENLFNNGGDIRKYLKSPDYGLGDIPVCDLDDKSAELYKHGGFIKTGGADGLRRVYCGSEFIGIGNIADGILHPKRTI